MKNYKKMVLQATILCFSGICNIAAAASKYTVTAVDTAQLSYSSAARINAHGQMVGWGFNSGGTDLSFYLDAHSFSVVGGFRANDNNDFGDAVGVGSNGRAVIYHEGTIGNLISGDPGGSIALGINNAGQVVGISGGSAFLYEAGQVTWLSNPFGGTSMSAYAVSNSGHITGGGATPSGEQAYLYQGGTMLGLGTLGGNYAWGRDVNDLGQVVGESFTSNGAMHAFLYTNHQMLDITPTGSDGASALGVNSAGQVVGSYSVNFNGIPGSGEFRGFLYENGNAVDLNSLIDPASGWHVDWASAINDRGQIAANGCNGFGCTALLLTPVPEPSTVLYLVAGLGLLGVTKRRQG